MYVGGWFFVKAAADGAAGWYPAAMSSPKPAGGPARPPARQRVEAGGFVLTGGQSHRMGSDKGLLGLGGRPLVLWTVERLRPLVAEVVLVGAPERYGHLGLPVLADREANRGPLGGLATALAATEYDWNLVLACDLPYLETRFLEFLLELAGVADADAVVPETQGHWQPLCAAYHRRCLPAFERVLAGGHPRIVLAFEQIRVRALSSEELQRFAFEEQILKNMNTPEDYAEAKRLLGGQAGG